MSPTATKCPHACPQENSSKAQQSLYLVPGPSLQVMVHLRQAGTWDPLLQCLHLDISSSNKIQRNYKGLKITACVSRWLKPWTKRYKKAKTQLPLLRFLEQKQGAMHDACTEHHKGGGQTTQSPSGPHRSTPPLTPLKEPARPLRGVSKGTFNLPLLPHATALVPIKPCLNSSSVLLAGSID